MQCQVNDLWKSMREIHVIAGIDQLIFTVQYDVAFFHYVNTTFVHKFRGGLNT